MLVSELASTGVLLAKTIAAAHPVINVYTLRIPTYLLPHINTYSANQAAACHT